MFSVPAQSSKLTPIETAYVSNEKGNPACWGARSQILGAPMQVKQGAGLSFGAVADSRFCNRRDASLSCMQDNYMKNMAYGVGKGPAQDALFSYLDGHAVNPGFSAAIVTGGSPNKGSFAGTAFVGSTGDGRDQRSYGSYSSCVNCGGAGYLNYGEPGPCGCNQFIRDLGEPANQGPYTGSQVGAFGWSPESATILAAQRACQPCSGTPQFREQSNFLANPYSCRAAKYPCLPGQKCVNGTAIPNPA